MELFDLTEKLCLADGTSSDEADVTELILSLLPSDVKAYVDPLGNIIAEKKGRATPKNKVMLAAHQDEVGFIVTYITSEGYLRFDAVGGINPEVVIGRTVHFKNGIRGVIGTKPIHHQDTKERKRQPEIKELLIDIGATDEENARQYVTQGDTAYFSPGWQEMGEGYLKAKALDDRLGCAMLIDLLNSELPYDVTCVFTVQEEIGTNGAITSAFTVKPDFAIVIETTTACDFAGNEGDKRVCELGRGCVASYMDRGAIYDKELYRLAFERAKENNIPVQTKTVVAGGNDSRSIQVSTGGVRTIALSVPCRYLHSPACMIKKSDVIATNQLMRIMYEELCSI